jgi:hypothetical protein
MRHTKNTIKLGRQAEHRNFAAGQTGLQPHRVESNQDDLGKGEDVWWFEGCIEGSSRFESFQHLLNVEKSSNQAAELYFTTIPERIR